MDRLPLHLLTLSFLLLITISLCSCTSNKHITKSNDKLYDLIPGRWSIERRNKFPEAVLSRSLGLNQGIVIFYPNGSFMYRNKTERQTGFWYIDTEVARESEYWIMDVQVPEQVYTACKVFLTFNEKPNGGNVFDAVIFYTSDKKLKIRSELHGNIVVNILRRKQ